MSIPWIAEATGIKSSAQEGPEEFFGTGVIPPHPLGMPLDSDGMALSDKLSYDPARPEVG
jgi:hypothetical protein